MLKKLVCGDKIDDEQDDISSVDEAVDGVLKGAFVGENLLVVQEVTVCNRPLCSVSERGVRCSDVDLDAIVSEMEKFRLIAGDYRCVCVSVIRSSEMINYLEIAIRVVWLIFL